jgi:rhamnose transport system ATP-binding protein
LNSNLSHPDSPDLKLAHSVSCPFPESKVVALEPLLHLEKISKRFGGVVALDDVSFDLRAGEVHALVGENGAGKSTLVRVITGAIEPDQGAISAFGSPLEHNDPVRSRRLGIAAIYQQPVLFPDLSVTENLAIGVERISSIRVINWGSRKRRARELLAQLDADISPNALVRELSMPQQQLVEIARALGANSRVLILDEPTASLGTRETERLFRVIHDLKAQGVGLIYISHRLEELPEVADRVTVLRDGRLVATCPMQDVDRASLIRMMVGRELSTVFPKREVPIREVVLEVEGLSSHHSLVRNCNFSIRSGEIVGLAGMVGSGRTELARILFGLTPADSGTIRLRGVSVQIDSPVRAIELGLAYVPEDRRRHGVIAAMTVAENATLASLRAISRHGWIDFRRERRLASELTTQLSVKAASIGSPVGELSGGNQQKVALARWLAIMPAVLILDEPTQGVDVGAKSEIHRLMVDLAERGLAILMISSELPEILGMSDRIVIMNNGTTFAALDREEATQEAVIGFALARPGTAPRSGKAAS